MKVNRDEIIKIIMNDIEDTEGMLRRQQAKYILSSIETRCGILVQWDEPKAEAKRR